MALPKSAPSNDILGLESLLLGTNRYPKIVRDGTFFCALFCQRACGMPNQRKGRATVRATGDDFGSSSFDAVFAKRLNICRASGAEIANPNGV
jgi:hypothetical protein